MRHWLERYIALHDKENEGGTPFDEPVVKERMAELTRRYHDSERKAKSLEEKNALTESELAAAKALLEGKETPPKKEEPERRAAPVVEARKPTAKELLDDPDVRQELANTQAQETAATEMKEKSDKLYDDGVKKFGENKWDAALATFKNFDGIHVAVAETVFELDNGVDVMHYLGTHPDEIARIYKLKSPTKIILEVEKLAAKVKAAEKKQSKAPEPPEDLGGRSDGSGVVDLADKDVSMRDWVKAREKDLKDRGVRI